MRILAERLFCALAAFFFCLFSPAWTWADPANAGSGGFMLPFSDDADIAKDFQALAPAVLPWSPNTSGPFFTGTAEVDPIGSWYLEPIFAYDFLTAGSSSLYNPIRFSIGLGHDLELDTFIPLIQNWESPL
jgi:hypothetical protein